MVDLHLDVIPERRRPRATVELDLDSVVSTLDAEVAASGIGTVCIGVRCEEEPGKGLRLADAAELARSLERLGDRLSSDWRVHARVEVTDEGSVEALAEVLACSTRMALVSIMEHSAQRSRFGSEREHVEFYSRDWGLPVDEVERIMERKHRGALRADDRRVAAAERALAHGVLLGTHDDRSAEQVRAGAELGATIAEFPLTMEAARAANEHGMITVLGAPNVVRGRSTSPGNLLASDAIRPVSSTRCALTTCPPPCCMHRACSPRTASRPARSKRSWPPIPAGPSGWSTSPSPSASRCTRR
jgi:alpha-D-ribose 1-methylphosphonate 5-triphosphate diphosphatase